MPALFYHVTRTPLEEVAQVLLTKALGQGWRVELRGASPERMDWLDEKLWLGPEEEFLAHARACGGPEDAVQPVLLTCGGAVAASQAASGRQALMTVEGAEVAAAEVAALERVWILFDGGSEPAVQRARDQWRALTAAGAAAQYWSEDGGRWQKKAES